MFVVFVLQSLPLLGVLESFWTYPMGLLNRMVLFFEPSFWHRVAFLGGGSCVSFAALPRPCVRPGPTVQALFVCVVLKFCSMHPAGLADCKLALVVFTAVCVYFLWGGSTNA